MAEQLIPYRGGVEYNGSNGAAILAEIPLYGINDYNVYIISESDETLVLGYDDAGPNSATFIAGDWVTWGPSGRPEKMPLGEFGKTYIKRSDLP